MYFQRDNVQNFYSVPPQIGPGVDPEWHSPDTDTDIIQLLMEFSLDPASSPLVTEPGMWVVAKTWSSVEAVGQRDDTIIVPIPPALTQALEEEIPIAIAREGGIDVDTAAIQAAIGGVPEYQGRYGDESPLYETPDILYAVEPPPGEVGAYTVRPDQEVDGDEYALYIRYGQLFYGRSRVCEAYIAHRDKVVVSRVEVYRRLVPGTTTRRELYVAVSDCPLCHADYEGTDICGHIPCKCGFFFPWKRVDRRSSLHRMYFEFAHELFLPSSIREAAASRACYKPASSARALRELAFAARSTELAAGCSVWDSRDPDRGTSAVVMVPELAKPMDCSSPPESPVDAPMPALDSGECLLGDNLVEGTLHRVSDPIGALPPGLWSSSRGWDYTTWDAFEPAPETGEKEKEKEKEREFIVTADDDVFDLLDLDECEDQDQPPPPRGWTAMVSAFESTARAAEEMRKRLVTFSDQRTPDALNCDRGTRKTNGDSTQGLDGKYYFDGDRCMPKVAGYDPLKHTLAELSAIEREISQEVPVKYSQEGLIDGVVWYASIDCSGLAGHASTARGTARTKQRALASAAHAALFHLNREGLWPCSSDRDRDVQAEFINRYTAAFGQTPRFVTRAYGWRNHAFVQMGGTAFVHGRALGTNAARAEASREGLEWLRPWKHMSVPPLHPEAFVRIERYIREDTLGEMHQPD